LKALDKAFNTDYSFSGIYDDLQFSKKAMQAAGK